MKKSVLILAIAFLSHGICFSQWVIQYVSNPAQTVMALKFYDDNTGYYSGVRYDNSPFNVYKTTNGGANFTSQSSNLLAQRFMCEWIFHPDTVLLGGNYGKIIKTVNGGTNWNLVYADTTLQFWSFNFVNQNTGFVSGSFGRIMKTTNKGDNWTILTTGVPNALDGMWFVNENTGYAGGSNIILKTTNGGQSWVNKVGLFISGFETAQALYFSDANTGYYCTNTFNARIVKTTNGGDTWTLIHSQDSLNGAWGMSFVNASTGYVCTGSGKVLKTTNAGVNWFVQTTPLTENLYEIHFPSANTGYIASWSGKILKTTNGGVTFVEKQNNEIPEHFILNQNYPNPFNPTTYIRFSISSSEFVKLQIFDVAGRIVSIPVDENLAPGTYKIAFNEENLSSGTYFYKLNAGGYSETKKMILLK